MERIRNTQKMFRYALGASLLAGVIAHADTTPTQAAGNQSDIPSSPATSSERVSLPRPVSIIYIGGLGTEGAEKDPVFAATLKKTYGLNLSVHSIHPETPKDPDPVETADKIAAEVDAAIARNEKIIVVAHSMGPRLMQLYIARNILNSKNSSTYNPKKLEHFLAFIYASPRSNDINNATNYAGLVNYPKAFVVDPQAKVLESPISQQTLEDMQRYIGPRLIVLAGENDPVIPFSQQKACAEELHGRLIRGKDWGHFGTVTSGEIIRVLVEEIDSAYNASENLRELVLRRSAPSLRADARRSRAQKGPATDARSSQEKGRFVESTIIYQRRSQSSSTYPEETPITA